MRHTRRFLAAAAVSAALFSIGAQAGERVQIRGSTEVELPKPSPNFEPGRKFKQDEERPSLEGGFIPPPAIEGNLLFDKRAKEFLDKKKNWIFVNPYQNNYDTKTEEFLKGEKGTGLFNNRLMMDEDKSQVEKYMEESSSNGRPDTKSKDNEKNDNARPERFRKDNSSLRYDDDTDDRNKESSSSSIFKSTSKGERLETGSPGGERIIFAERPERGAMFDRSLDPGRNSEMTLAEKQKLREQQQQHDREFTQFLQNGRGGGASLGLSSGLRLDPLNRASDSTRLDGTPSAPGRSDQYLNLGRSQAGTFGGSSGAAASSIPAPPSRRVDDFAAPMARPSNPFSAPASSSFNQPEAPSFTPSPFQLPFPKRKF